tara:strand:+ start:1199 stop:1876 length:678 start_codon:yes stop_codon:yes gene_type:complete
MASAKTCKACGETKAVDQFYRKQGKCKVCWAQYQQQYRKDNKEAAKQWRADNRETIAAKRQTPEARARAAATARTPERRAARSAARNARRSTPEGKVNNSASTLHRSFYLGDLGAVRLRKAENLVGCTRQEYRDYIASQFKSGMSHGNTDWEIDHIVPKKAFKGELEANLQVVYWYGNVQPLWKAENYAKGGKFTAEAKQSLITRHNAWKAAGSPPPGIWIYHMP